MKLAYRLVELFNTINNNTNIKDWIFKLIIITGILLFLKGFYLEGNLLIIYSIEILL